MYIFTLFTIAIQLFLIQPHVKTNKTRYDHICNNIVILLQLFFTLINCMELLPDTYKPGLNKPLDQFDKPWQTHMRFLDIDQVWVVITMSEEV